MRIKAILHVKLLDSTFLRLRPHDAFEILSANPELLFVSTPIIFNVVILNFSTFQYK